MERGPLADEAPPEGESAPVPQLGRADAGSLDYHFKRFPAGANREKQSPGQLSSTMLPLEGPSPVHLINIKEFRTDEKLEGDSVNKVLLFSTPSHTKTQDVTQDKGTRLSEARSNSCWTHAGADGGLSRLQQHAN